MSRPRCLATLRFGPHVDVRLTIVLAKLTGKLPEDYAFDAGQDYLGMALRRLRLGIEAGTATLNDFSLNDGEGEGGGGEEGRELLDEEGEGAPQASRCRAAAMSQPRCHVTAVS